MKKIVINFILFIIILFVALIGVLSTTGIETNKFNKLITEKTSQVKNINLKLETIKFRINPKDLSLFLIELPKTFLILLFCAVLKYGTLTQVKLFRVFKVAKPIGRELNMSLDANN